MSEQSPEQIGEERAYTLGTAAYLWGFTMNELYRARSHALATPGAAVNTFAHRRALLTPEMARKGGVVCSNSATLYSSAWLELSVEPIVLEFPAVPDRYFTFNSVDFYQRNENLSNATIGRGGGAYAFVGPADGSVDLLLTESAWRQRLEFEYRLAPEPSSRC